MLFLCKQKLDLAETRGMLPPTLQLPGMTASAPARHRGPRRSHPQGFFSLFSISDSADPYSTVGKPVLSWSLWLLLPCSKRMPSDWEGQGNILLNSPLSFQKPCPWGHVELNQRKHPAVCVAQTPRSLCPGRLPVLDQDFLALPLLWNYIFSWCL